MSESPSRHDVDRLIYAGLLGLAATAAIQLLDVGELGAARLIAVYAFAAAIPLLTTGLVTDYARRAGITVPLWRDALGFFGVLTAVVGLAALFFHFGIGPGAVFVIGTLASIILIRLL